MSNHRGTALLSVVTILALLLPLAAHIVFQSQIDILIARNFRDQTDTMYLAEAGVEHALAYIGSVAAIGALLSGPDRVARSADDGELPLPRLAGFASTNAYTLHVDQIGKSIVEITSTAHGQNGTTRAVAALIQASDTPFTPAAFFLAGNIRPLTLNPSGLDISGQDGLASTVRVPDISFATALRERFDVNVLSPQLAALPTATRLPAGSAPAVLGAIASPQLTIVDGDLEVSGTTSGAGILIVRGALRVTGGLRFDGLLVTTGPMQARSESRVTISGAVWQTSEVEGVSLEGRGFIHYSSAALGLADTVAPGVLPHALRVLGRHDVS